MKLEAGKYYQNRVGEIHGPLRVTKQYPDRFTDELGSWYAESGRYWQQGDFCPFSLVAEASSLPRPARNTPGEAS